MSGKQTAEGSMYIPASNNIQTLNRAMQTNQETDPMQHENTQSINSSN